MKAENGTFSTFQMHAHTQRGTRKETREHTKRKSLKNTQKE